jgi:pSer/pThr/pTyr-binding forkhead associated (FHA) protein
MTPPCPYPPARLIRLEAGQPASYLLEANLCTIGRSPLCQLLIAHPIVSRLHAKIERQGAHYLLSDVGSVNGTFLNGRRLGKPHLLLDGDLIGLGSAVPILRFEA